MDHVGARLFGQGLEQRAIEKALEDRWVPSTLQVVNGLLTYTAGPGVATYDFEPFATGVTTIGRTRVSVPYTASAGGAGLELNARLYEVLANGSAVLVDRGGVRIAQASGTTVFDLNGNAWRFTKGDRLRIELAQDDDPYVARSSQPSTLTLAGVTLELPVR